LGLFCFPSVLIGLIVWACRSLYCFFVGNQSGYRLIKAASVLSTPMREVGHAMMAVLFWHRIEDVQLLNIGDPDGEFGFVEHSYNPRNPVALLGNFFYAMGPVVLGLLAVSLIFLTCFHGVLPAYFDEIRALGDAGAGVGEYLKAAFSFIPKMFTLGEAAMWLRVIGCALLVFLCLGIYVSPLELMEAASGIAILVGLVMAASGVMMLFDDRVMRIAIGGLRSFSTVVIALFLVVLVFSAGLLAFGALFALIRTLFNIDSVDASNED
jgi:hypothetical protein